MDIEKLIEQANRFGMELRRDGGEFEYSIGEKFLNYATALSTLQAENAQLRADLEYEREHANAYHEECGQWEAENEKLRAEVKMWKCRCKEIVSHASELDMDLQNAEKENAELLAELKQVINQRDNYHMYHYELALKPNCNTCADKDCKYRPIPGDTVRANCPLWRGPDKKG